MGSGNCKTVQINFINPAEISNGLSPIFIAECPVCFEKRQLYQYTQCTHATCKECTDKLENTCPLCREKIVDGYSLEEYHKNVLDSLESAGLA